MKVWILWGLIDYEEDMLLGIFSTQARAEEELKKQEPSYWGNGIRLSVEEDYVED